MSIISFFTKFFTIQNQISKTQDQVSAVDLKVLRLQRKKKASEVSVEISLARLEKAEKVAQSEIEKTRIALKSAQIINNQLEEALTALRDELKTVNDITIPGLVAANRLFIDRWESESKIHVMRASLADVRREE